MNVEQILIENLVQAVSKIEAQDTKSFDPKTALCHYVAPTTGARCLFGHCMKTPDPELQLGIDASPALNQLADFLDLTEDDLRPFTRDLMLLQVVHDNAWEPDIRFVDAMVTEDGGPLYQRLEEALQ